MTREDQLEITKGLLAFFIWASGHRGSFTAKADGVSLRFGDLRCHVDLEAQAEQDEHNERAEQEDMRIRDEMEKWS